MSIQERLEQLEELLSRFDSCGIAFSGGVDSTFLLAAAVRTLGVERVTALTVIPPYVAGWEIDEARDLAAEMGVRHIRMEAEMIEELRHNPEDRCYICKSALFSGMKERCSREGIQVLCDGSNADDVGDFRPGMRALKELGIRSPLLEAGLSKGDIREISREWELPTWDKPPYACLLTRIPHGTEIRQEMLERIEKSEVVLIESGFPAVRVRHHGDVARIELPKSRFEEFIVGGYYSMVQEKLKGFGYSFVTLDLGGYKMGSMNPKGVKGE